MEIFDANNSDELCLVCRNHGISWNVHESPAPAAGSSAGACPGPALPCAGRAGGDGPGTGRRPEAAAVVRTTAAWTHGGRGRSPTVSAARPAHAGGPVRAQRRSAQPHGAERPAVLPRGKKAAGAGSQQGWGARAVPFPAARKGNGRRAEKKEGARRPLPSESGYGARYSSGGSSLSWAMVNTGPSTQT